MSRIIVWIVAAVVIGSLVFTDFALAESSRFEQLIEQQIGTPDAAPVIHVAQRKKRRTLLDLLFGEPEPQQQQQVPVEEVPRETPSAPVAQEPPPPPKVEKSPTATRLAVFGDSLAVDFAKALDRFYAEDPNLIVVQAGVGDSGFVRPDFYDWNKVIGEQITQNTFDIAVVLLGINDRQTIHEGDQSFKSLTPEWTNLYQQRINTFAAQLRIARKPTIWIGLPPMSKSEYSAALSQISAMYRMAAFANGAEYLDIFERFLDEEGKYSSYGPDLNGQRVRMRKEDGIHFSRAGADKLAFYASQSIKLFYQGGAAISLQVADPLAGTDAQLMQRPPFQGLGQIRLLEVAGAVIPLSNATKRAVDLVSADTAAADPAVFDLEQMMLAPVGRVDAFGAGVVPVEDMNEDGR
jgi:hypothetical protein